MQKLVVEAAWRSDAPRWIADKEREEAARQLGEDLVDALLAYPPLTAFQIGIVDSTITKPALEAGTDGDGPWITYRTYYRIEARFAPHKEPSDERHP